jgi:hypothetical protein
VGPRAGLDPVEKRSWNCKTMFGEVSHVKFCENLPSNLWDIRKNTFVALYKQGFVWIQYGCKLELPDNSWWKSPILNFKNILETFYGIYGKVH